MHVLVNGVGSFFDVEGPERAPHHLLHDEEIAGAGPC